MAAAKVYNINLKFTIATSQLVWTQHGKERLAERRLQLPSHISQWDMIGYDWSEKGAYPNMVLRHRQRGRQDIVLVVTKAKEDGRYLVVTGYWDDKAVAV